MYTCGIDEAGRGPVLGPLVMAAVITDKETEDKLVKLGVKDSKLLSEEKRESLYKEIIKLAQSYSIKSIDPKTIDTHVKSEKSSLNILEAHTTAELLNEVNAENAIVDLPQKDAQKYTESIREKLKNQNIKITAEHKADYNYVSVAAASILAKVTRDRKIEDIKTRTGIDVGSGYPADPKTKTFLENHWNNPEFDFIRKEWSSWKNIKEEKAQKSLFEF